jgi:hypothetical protein
MALAPDPADKGADQFKAQPSLHRVGDWTLEQWLDWLARYPDAALPSGVGGMLAAEIHRLRDTNAR